jgi:hypothetical protein
MNHVLCRLFGLGLCASLLGTATAQTVPTPLPEQPSQESPAGAPPTGLVLAPGVHLAGYATLQWLAPRGNSLSPDGSDGESDAVEAGKYAHDSPQASNRSRLNLSHLSAILWWEPSATWKFLGEVDAEDVAQVPAHVDREDGHNSARYISLERLYGDYRLDDALTLRVGKFLTPIGGWNQEHSDPLTWTTLRPLISHSAFPTNATGAEFFGSLPLVGQWTDFQLWASQGSEWRSNPAETPFKRAVGLRVATALTPAWQIGASLADFAQREGAAPRFVLAGLDMVWRWHGAELSAEGIARRPTGGAGGDERGGFVQMALPLAPHWFGVARGEVYKRASDRQGLRSATLGAVYRSGQHWVGKAEWVQPEAGAERLPQGFLASLTALF